MFSLSTHTELWGIEVSREVSWQTNIEIKFTPKNDWREKIVVVSLGISERPGAAQNVRSEPSGSNNISLKNWRRKTEVAEDVLDAVDQRDDLWMKKVRSRTNWVKGRVDRHKDWSKSGFLYYLLFDLDCAYSSYHDYPGDITSRALEETVALTDRMIISEVLFIRLSSILCNWNGTVATCLFSFPIQIILRQGL